MAKTGTKSITKPSHGGKRKGAGRPKTKEDTVVMRVPLSLVSRVKEMIANQGEIKDYKKVKKKK